MTEQSGAVYKPQSRSISEKTSILLYTQAGGRCEFDGCNKYLLEHYPTETVGNFGARAHIYAFKQAGPRGNESGRPSDINHLSNLMLLCPACHTLVDDYPGRYPVSVLKKFKKDHEDRIYDLTGIAKDRDTVPLVLKGLVAGRPVDISLEEMQSAVAPNYLKRRQLVEIDLTSFTDQPKPYYWEACKTKIDQEIPRIYNANLRSGCAIKVSVFAIAPIPLLIYLGSKLSDKVEVNLYQRHRDTETWIWNGGKGSAQYDTQLLKEGKDSSLVSLLINLSGRNPVDSLPDHVSDGTVYELTLCNQNCSPLFLNAQEDLNRFVVEFNQTLARIRQTHPSLVCLNLFPTVPAPVAIAMGRSRLPKADPPFKVYDYDRRASGFVFTLEVS